MAPAGLLGMWRHVGSPSPGGNMPRAFFRISHGSDEFVRRGLGARVAMAEPASLSRRRGGRCYPRKRGRGASQAWPGLSRRRGPTGPGTAQRVRRRHRVPGWDARIRNDPRKARTPPRWPRGLLHRDDQQPIPAGDPQPRDGPGRRRGLKRLRRASPAPAEGHAGCGRRGPFACTLPPGRPRASRPCGSRFAASTPTSRCCRRQQRAHRSPRGAARLPPTSPRATTRAGVVEHPRQAARVVSGSRRAFVG